MEYKEFLNKCISINDGFTGDGELQLSYFNDGYCGYNKKCIKDKPRLYAEWETGGVSGGSCWESSDPQPYTSEEQPKSLQILDTILESVCPNIGFLQYKNLMNSLCKSDSRTNHEYYGNCTNYSTISVDVKDLFNYLKEKKLIE